MSTMVGSEYRENGEGKGERGSKRSGTKRIRRPPGRLMMLITHPNVLNDTKVAPRTVSHASRPPSGGSAYSSMANGEGFSEGGSAEDGLVVVSPSMALSACMDSSADWTRDTGDEWASSTSGEVMVVRGVRGEGDLVVVGI